MKRVLIVLVLIILAPQEIREEQKKFFEKMVVVNISPEEDCGLDEAVKWETSWYGPGFHGRPMANTEIFDMFNPTQAAHKTLEFGTELRVTNPANCREVLVTVTDRGPYVGQRELDLSFAAAAEIDFVEKGVGPLLVEVVAPTGRN